MSVFPSVQIGAIAKVKGGKRLPKGEVVQATRTEFPYIRVADLHANGVDVDSVKFIRPQAHSAISRYTISGDDIYISIAGTVGLVGIVPPLLSGANLTENAAKITSIDPSVDHKYLMYFLRSEIGQAKIIAKTGGAAQPKLALYRVAEIEFPLIPLEAQRRIASILGAYDNLIEVNRRRIALLEEMARVLFEEWFVRFCFPGHKEVPILDTPNGPLPEGWGHAAFGSLLEHTIGGLWGEASQTVSNDQRVSVVRGTDFPKLLAGNYALVPDRFVSSRELASRALLPGDLILEASGGSKDQPVGRVFYTTASLIEKLSPPVAPASFCRLLRPKLESGAYLYGLLQKMYQDKRIEKFQKQSTGLRNLSMKQLAAETVIVPDATNLESFGRMTLPLLEAASLHRHECRALSASRDLLLPRLISGKLAVAAAGRELEAA